jgi:glyoxylase-like metal-dependent hydrolase (beta-lactamase superfamily II)
LAAIERLSLPGGGAAALLEPAAARDERGDMADRTQPDARRWARLIVAPTALFLLVVGVLAALFAPYVSAETSSWLEPHRIVDAAPARLAKGRMVDDYFAVEDLGGQTYAIGEPRYYQRNYAYLIVGRTRALLFDSGSGTRDIRPVVASLTTLPVTVMVSHLHYDHIGGIAPFQSVAMIDLPQTRADVRGGWFQPTRYQYLGLIDRLSAPKTRVTEWVAAGSVIDLGGRSLRVISTPGHTPTSAALFDAANHRLFIGDFIYPTTLYAFLPGASLSAYRQTARRLINTLPADTVLWAAHCCRAGEGVSAPWLTMSDVADLERALGGVASGRLRSTGFYPRIYPVNAQMTLATGFAWNNR